MSFRKRNCFYFSDGKSILSSYDEKTDYVGGSSVATAATAGIAALVLAKNPSWTRDQVIDKMKKLATYYPMVTGISMS